MVMLTVFPILMLLVDGREQKNVEEDRQTLRECIAEAYINIMEDPDYVYTGTDDQPMQVPEKYYTVKESLLGEGRVYAVVDRNNNVDAYFGVPERNLDYYMRWDYEPRTDWIVKLLPYIQFVFLVVLIGLSIYRSYRNDLKKRHKVEDEEGASPVQKTKARKISGMTASYNVTLVLVLLYMLAWFILREFNISRASFLYEVLCRLNDLPFIIAVGGMLDTVITFWEQKGVARWLTILTGVLSFCLMVAVLQTSFGLWFAYKTVMRLPFIILGCWLLRNYLYHRTLNKECTG
jgi:hypothetical protein